MKKSRIIKFPVMVIFIVCGIMLVYFSSVCKAGIKEGLSICANTIIPSLFPFLCFSNIALGVFNKSSGNKTLEKIFFALFSLPLCTAKVLIFSLIGGYPVGPMMSASMLENGQINKAQAKRLMLFCCNSGPAFSIIAVGMNLCFSRKLGVFLCISTTTASIIMGLILGRFKIKNSERKVETVHTEKRIFLQF